MATPKKLTSISDDELTRQLQELEAEQRRRREEKKKKAMQEAQEENLHVLENMTILLPLLHHSRTSCTDTQLSNLEEGCPRCILLDAARSGYLDPEKMVVLEVRSRSL